MESVGLGRLESLPSLRTEMPGAILPPPLSLPLGLEAGTLQVLTLVFSKGL